MVRTDAGEPARNRFALEAKVCVCWAGTSAAQVKELGEVECLKAKHSPIVRVWVWGCLLYLQNSTHMS